MSSKSNGLGPGKVEVDGRNYHSITFEHEGTRYTLRELTVDESDDIYDATLQPDGRTVNARLNNRMALSKSLVTPAMTVDEIGKLGSKTYFVIMGEFNALNALPEANPTPPAGSAGETSPSGGTPIPAP